MYVHGMPKIRQNDGSNQNGVSRNQFFFWKESKILNFEILEWEITILFFQILCQNINFAPNRLKKIIIIEKNVFLTKKKE